MILPIGDEPNPRGTPWVTYALLAVNAAVFLLLSLPLMSRGADPSDPAVQQLLRALIAANPDADPRLILHTVLKGRSAYDFFLLRWGYVPADLQLLSLFSSMFLHGGWAHLLGNMLFLWIYGDNVEHALGRVGYLAAYLATGLVAALGYGLFVPADQGQIPMVGASGAISGVLGFYFVWFPRNRVRLMIVPFIFWVWKVQARLVLGFYLIVDNLLPFLLDQHGSSVAHGAHIGGFVGGVVAALLLNQWSRFRCRRRAAECDGFAARGTTDAGADQVVHAMDRAEAAEAIHLYLALPGAERRRLPLAVVASLADWLTAQGQVDAALALYRQGQDDHPRGPGLDRIFLGIGLALLHGKGRPTAAYQYLLDALDAGPEEEVRRRAREALDQIEALQKLRIRPR